jgi:purine-binding chemotaxis protein CheW
MSTDNKAVLDVALDETGGTQYLTFLLADEQYGLNILQVQEIRGWEAVTRVPNTPDYVKGVINLRGTIVPVLDLRRRFGLDDTEYTMETVVIVVRLTDKDGAERSLGLVVDAVSDVLVARDDAIASTPDFAAGVPTESILGLLDDGGHMVILLDVGALLESESAADDDVD